MPVLKIDIPTNPDWQPPNGWCHPDDLDRAYYKRLGAWRKLGYDLKPGQGEPAKWARSWGGTSYVAYWHIDQVQKVDQSHRFQTGQVLSESIE